MNQIIIVEYNPSLAKGIAQMWNNSKEGWNGDAGHNTEKSILLKEAQASHLNLYIALEGELVVGYCKLSKYAYDENTLYIDLLNVLPSYHGKRVGKMLVLKALERTIELGYPRLDLFTWAGNTKAVPLYKKTGFFWEKMEANSTHLMNFLPTALKTELVSDYFSDIDWYNDSCRVLDICPDGIKVNDFDHYQYHWEKNGQYLKMNFEKTGRGLVAIDCNEFMIETHVEANKLVFGQKHEITYKIINKSQQPLQVNICGKNDKNIQFDFTYDKIITDTEIINAEFYLDKIEKNQNMWITHPCVISDIFINNKKATFKTGIKPLFPLIFQYAKPFKLVNKNFKYDLIINVENNFDQDCDFMVQLPEWKDVEFLKKQLFFSLKAKEKSNLTIPIILKNSIVLYTSIKIEAFLSTSIELDDKSEKKACIQYEQNFELLLNTYQGKVCGEGSNLYVLNSGKNMLYVDKDNDYNEMTFKNLLSEIWAVIGIPKVGKPFSSEFHNKKAHSLKFVETNDYLMLSLFHRSDDFSGCEFACHYKLYPQGFMEYQIELLKYPENKNEINLSYSFCFDRAHMQMSYNGDLIKTDDSKFNDSEMIFWDSQKIDENWLYNENDTSTIALIWDKQVKPISCSWHYVVEHHFDKNSERMTPPLTIAIDYFHSVKQVRQFALMKDLEPKKSNQCIDLIINEGNPFVEPHLNVSHLDRKDKALECSCEISSLNNTFEPVTQSVIESQQLFQIDFDVMIKNKEDFQLIQDLSEYNAKSFTIQKACFLKQEGLIKTNKHISGINQIYSVDNGVLTFSSSPEFAPSVFSLKFKGIEWLDCDFPEKGPKAWWNPWIGGLCNMPSGFKTLFYLEEETHAEFVKREDNFGNLWQGIEVTTNIAHYNPLKGVNIKQYFLVLPSMPFILYFYVLEQNNGFVKSLHPFSELFVKADEDLKNTQFEYTYNGQQVSTKCGVEDIGFSTNASMVCFKGKNRSEKMYAYNGDIESSMSVGSNLSVTNSSFHDYVNLKNDQPYISAPRYLIFSEMELKENWLKDLKNIRFK